MVSATPSSPSSRRPKFSAASPADSTKPGSTGSSASITRFCLLILLLNCCGAIYHSRHDPWSVAFVAASFIDLALLFHLIHRFEAAPPGSAARGRIKAGVWSLTSILTVMFAYKVAALMPWAAAIAVWTMGAVTMVAGFCMFFLCGDAEQGNSDDEPLKAAEDGANEQHRSGGSLGAPSLHQPILSS